MAAVMAAPFNGMCRTLDCFFGPQATDDCANEWMAIQVHRDGNAEEIGGPFDTIEEAEECAGEERARQLKDHGFNGVGA